MRATRADVLGIEKASKVRINFRLTAAGRSIDQPANGSSITCTLRDKRALWTLCELALCISRLFHRGQLKETHPKLATPLASYLDAWVVAVSLA